MARASVIGNPQPYRCFGTFAGLPFWPGGLTLVAAAPGVGKTSWLLRTVFEALTAGFPAALGCYEHTAEELKYRLQLQTNAAVAGPHGEPDEVDVENLLATGGETVLLALSSREDTIRAIEQILLEDYAFPEKGPAVLAVDYLQRIPMVGLTGLVPEDQRSGEAAAGLRDLARKRGWAVIVACALRGGHFRGANDLSALLGDERVSYEADRVLLAQRSGPVHPCGCVMLDVHTLKNRTGPAHIWQMGFWGERFYPALEGELDHP
ncbi:MAG: DnaB-like helicase C-terminal domain-containing protein [Anaerolineales bacterium]